MLTVLLEYIDLCECPLENTNLLGNFVLDAISYMHCARWAPTCRVP